MIFLYNFYKLLSLHQHMLYHTSFETVLSLYEMKMNLCCKKPEPFGNLPDLKNFFDGSCLEIELFAKRKTNRLRPKILLICIQI